MTEAEAKTKWCPFARVSTDSTDNNAANRYAPQDENDTANFLVESMCIGSACMAWRMQRQNEDYGHGFCGLAGRP